jgi:hypothetical protein
LASKVQYQKMCGTFLNLPNLFSNTIILGVTQPLTELVPGILGGNAAFYWNQRLACAYIEVYYMESGLI